MARKHVSKKEMEHMLRKTRSYLMLEVGSSGMDLVDEFVEGIVSDFSLSEEFGSSLMDIIRDYKKLRKEYEQLDDTVEGK